MQIPIFFFLFFLVRLPGKEQEENVRRKVNRTLFQDKENIYFLMVDFAFRVPSYLRLDFWLEIGFMKLVENSFKAVLKYSCILHYFPFHFTEISI